MLSEDEFVKLYQALAKSPRGLLEEIARRLSLEISLNETEEGFMACVVFRIVDTTVELVRSATVEGALAQAVALGVDRRLAVIARMRAELDQVTDRITWAPLAFLLEKLILGASMPTPQGASLGASNVTKAGDSP